MTRRRSRTRRLERIVLTCIGFVAAGAWVYPVILAVLTSLKTQADVITNPLGFPNPITFDSFSQAWNVLYLGDLLKNSAVYAAGGSALAILLAIVPAYVFSRMHVLGGRAIFVLLLTTLALPQQTVIIPLYTLLNTLGLLNTRIGLILVHGIYGMPFELLLLTGFMANLPGELENAARVDGCSDWGVLRHIIIPLSLPAVAVGFMINFIDIWKEFIFALTFLSSQDVMPLTVGLLKTDVGQYFASFTLPAAAVIVAQLPLIVLFVIANRWITQGVYVGGVKE